MTAETPIPTGLADLDEATYGGLRPGQLVVIAGRFGHGADVLATHIARTAAVNHGVSTVFTSCRSDAQGVMRHLLAALASVDVDHIESHQLDDQEKDRITAASAPLKAASLFINSDLTISRIARHVARTCARLAVIEGVHLLHDEESFDNETHRADILARGLKMLARDTGIPVVVSVPPFPRESRPTNDVPVLSDFGYHEPFAANADLVLLARRPELNGEDWRAGEIDISIAKHRNGPAGKISAGFVGCYDRLMDLPGGFGTWPKDGES